MSVTTTRQGRRLHDRLVAMAKRWRKRADSLESKGNRAGFIGELRADSRACDWAHAEVTRLTAELSFARGTERSVGKGIARANSEVAVLRGQLEFRTRQRDHLLGPLTWAQATAANPMRES